MANPNTAQRQPCRILSFVKYLLHYRDATHCKRKIYTVQLKKILRFIELQICNQSSRIYSKKVIQEISAINLQSQRFKEE